ncbi:MAG: translation initiation factor IF-2 [Candidatus Yanofskybacteria bacterium RIFCSPLOWO2_01_FULL_42_49]|uniref:Translation initiation factor IF-2 n=1 Tax=Candidatus Yanofskybacteria bacterium RIFCSPLOWO2_01_FULL_42_49 TaxID=1802694 RepID=A0A1F8GCQ8_9BACT|nr:MAG: translation initiation factor IF-2 [Candidatus Yanofskybacteria bacterium RIFCSPLOWO2_01_FULL_42_49]
MSDAGNTTKNRLRPPVVVVLGHVDHGKTRLLDTIRKTNVMEKESGGITQHVGAYQIDMSKFRNVEISQKITFLDTPGHEAFTAIRSRGAKIADIAVLVVAADESVKPQTKEAIKIIKEENIPFIVAVNKIDKEGANVQKVKQDLAAEEVLVEDWGGKVPVVEISAKAGKNISELLDMILLVAELEELREDLSKPAEGVIIESHLDKRKGYVATALVQKGVLALGDWVAAGRVVGKIKMMEDFTGKSIEKAEPSQPVILTGWSEVPDTGASFVSVDSKTEAEKITDENKSLDLTPLFSFISESADPEKKIYNLVLKADVKSSLEAVDVSLKAVKSDKVRCNVIGYDIGDITENDVKTAIATKSDIVGFRVNIEPSVVRLTEKESIKVQTFDVIYELIEAIRKNMAEQLDPEIQRTLLGKLKVLALFKKDSKSQIVGGKVLSGKVVRGAVVDVVRNSEVIGKSKLGQLQHNKEDMAEVKEGLDAGMRLDVISGQPFAEVSVGDILEVYGEEKTIGSL